jgi:hypothetical protein
MRVIVEEDIYDQRLAGAPYGQLVSWEFFNIKSLQVNNINEFPRQFSVLIIWLKFYRTLQLHYVS